MNTKSFNEIIAWLRGVHVIIILKLANDDPTHAQEIAQSDCINDDFDSLDNELKCHYEYQFIMISMFVISYTRIIFYQFHQFLLLVNPYHRN